MSRIFLSHSSTDNAHAIAMRDWLAQEGWDDVFLDLDADRGIVAGERWQRRLHDAANRCEAVIFLVSPAWLKSEWCLREFHLAEKLNKRIFSVVIGKLKKADLPADVTRTWQFVDLAQGQDHDLFRVTLPDGEESHVTYSRSGLARLRNGLTRSGLDPRFFAWPPEGDRDRPPYRGMRPMEAEDAGIFFGREAPTIEALDRLRGLSEAAPPRLFVILGASGAGKSSFLRAGLWPRLQRDDRFFLPLPIVRPERAVLSGETGLIQSIEQACRGRAVKRSRAEIRKALEAGVGTAAQLLAELAEAAKPADSEAAPTLLLAVDQAEELFQAAGRAESEAFLRLLAGLAMAATPRCIIVFTIRSDSYEPLQTAKAFEGLKQVPFSLSPIPTGAWGAVIEGPARRMTRAGRKLSIEPALTHRLLADLEAGGGKDALPLLAFTLERLFTEYGGDGDLKLAEYEEFGGVSGAIDAAVKQAMTAADGDSRVPPDAEARKALLRRALIPWLSGIDPDTGSPRRFVARLSEIPEEARPLVEHLVNARLLSTDGDLATGNATIEPAHEALLRQWSLLNGWLVEDAGSLASLEAVRHATRDWLANNRDRAWLNHRASRLDDAERLHHRPDLAAKLDAEDRAYLAACRESETAIREKERKAAERVRRITRAVRIAAVAASILAAIAGVTAWYGWNQARIAAEERDKAEDNFQEAQRQAEIANNKRKEALSSETLALASLSLVNSNNSSSIQAKLALSAWPRTGDSDRPQTGLAIAALKSSLNELVTAKLKGHNEGFQRVLSGENGQKLVAIGADNSVRLFGWPRFKEPALLDVKKGPVNQALVSHNGQLLATASEDGTVRLWDLDGNQQSTFNHESAARRVKFSAHDSALIVETAQNGTAIWEVSTGRLIAQLHIENWTIADAVIDDISGAIISAGPDGNINVWKKGQEGWEPELKVSLNDDQVTQIEISSDGKQLIGTSYGRVYLWNLETWEQTILEGPAESSLTGLALGKLTETSMFSAGGGGWTIGNKVVIPNRSSAEIFSGVSFFTEGTLAITTTTLSEEEDGPYRATIWDALSGEPLTELIEDSKINSAVFLSERTVALALANMSVTIWDLAERRRLAAYRSKDFVSRWSRNEKSPEDSQYTAESRVGSDYGNYEVLSLRGKETFVLDSDFSANDLLATSMSDGGVILWDLSTGERRREIHGSSEPYSSISFERSGKIMSGITNSGALSVWTVPDLDNQLSSAGRQSDNAIACLSEGLGLRAVVSKTGRIELLGQDISGTANSFFQVEGRPTSCTFSSDSRRLKVTMEDDTLHLLDVSDLKAAWRKESFPNVAMSEFSKDSKLLLLVLLDGSVTVMAMDGRTVAKPIENNGTEVAFATFGVEAGSILIVYEGGAIELISISDPEDRQDIDLDLDGVNSVSFSEHARRLAAVLPGGAVAIVDLDTLLEIGRVGENTYSQQSTSERGRMTTANFSPSGDFISVTRGRELKVYTIERGNVFEIACRYLGEDTSLEDVLVAYPGIEISTPICGGYIPLDPRMDAPGVLRR